jgi:hypothetical protein
LYHFWKIQNKNYLNWFLAKRITAKEVRNSSKLNLKCIDEVKGRNTSKSGSPSQVKSENLKVYSLLLLPADRQKKLYKAQI